MPFLALRCNLNKNKKREKPVSTKLTYKFYLTYIRTYYYYAGWQGRPVISRDNETTNVRQLHMYASKEIIRRFLVMLMFMLRLLLLMTCCCWKLDFWHLSTYLPTSFIHKYVWMQFSIITGSMGLYVCIISSYKPTTLDEETGINR